MTGVFHLSATYISSTLILVAGIFLLLIRLPRNEEWQYLRISRLCLFLSYTLLALSGIGSVLYEMSLGPILDRRSITLSVAFFQALLFTFTSIAYIRPRFLTRRVIALHIAYVVPFALLAVLHGAFSLSPVYLYVSAGAYVLLVMWCTWLFHRQYSQGLQMLQEHADQYFGSRMRWVLVIFYGALFVGLLALVFSVLHSNVILYDSFVVAHTLFYLYVIRCMRRCLEHQSYVIGIVSLEPSTVVLLPQPDQPQYIEVEDRPAYVSEAIDRWLSEERFLQPDVSIDEIATQLHATHDELNSWCMEHHGQLFRTWRMQLRIDKACQMLQDHPEMKISCLQECCGFTDKSHFLRQFKQMTGLTPTEYKKRKQTVYHISSAPRA